MSALNLQPRARRIVKHHGHTLTRPVFAVAPAGGGEGSEGGASAGAAQGSAARADGAAPVGDSRAGAGSTPTFPLHYVRYGPRHATPVLVIPGGPGLASIIPYQGFCRRAARMRNDIIMIEHRGIGMSGTTDDGTPLPIDAITIENVVDDIAAVLDHADVQRAIIVGSSYGTYVAQAFAITHPARVKALILDSPMLSVERDLAMTRAYRREMFWGNGIGNANPAARLIRRVATSGEPMAILSHVVQATYEFAGLEALGRLLHARLKGHATWLWKRIANSAKMEFASDDIPFIMQSQPVSKIAYAQLGFGLPPDGGPLDPQLTIAALTSAPFPFQGEPYDFYAAAPHYPWPTVVLSGDRDLQTPRPIAQTLVDMAPRGILIPLKRTGHSALDTHQLALLNVITQVAKGRISSLPARARRLSHLPRTGTSGLVSTILDAGIRLFTSPFIHSRDAHKFTMPPQ